MLPLVAKINEIEGSLQPLPDEALREKTAAWKAELSLIQDTALLQKRLNEILPEAFAVVKNAARRMVGQSFLICDHEYTWNMVRLVSLREAGDHRGKEESLCKGDSTGRGEVRGRD